MHSSGPGESQRAAMEPEKAGSSSQAEGEHGSTAGEDVSLTMSRLALAAQQGKVPNVVSFGHRRAGMGIPGVKRGRGGIKLPPGSHDYMQD